MEALETIIERFKKEINPGDIRGLEKVSVEVKGFNKYFRSAVKGATKQVEHLKTSYNLGKIFLDNYVVEVMRLQFCYEVIHKLRYCYQMEFANKFLQGKELPLLLPNRIGVPQYLQHEYREEHFTTFNHPLAMPAGKNKFDKQYSIYDDAPVDFVISDLPEGLYGRQKVLLGEIRRLYRVEVAYRKVFFDAQVRPFDIKAALEKKIKEYSLQELLCLDVPTLRLWHYASS